MPTLLDEIKSRASPAARASRDSQRIADEINVGRFKHSGVKLGKGLVIQTIGLASANQVLDVIDSAPDYRHVKHLLERGEMDSWDPSLVNAINLLKIGGLLTEAQATALIALGKMPDPVTEYQVRCACWSDAGEWLA